MVQAPGKFQFSLHQSWVLGTMNVAWLLFIAIVTNLHCTANLLRAGYVLS